MTGISIYLKNLWAALIGRNPYRMELDGLQEDVCRLSQECDDLKDKVGLFEAAFKDSHETVREDALMIRNLERLVENLRERIKEKDALVAQMQESYGRSEKEHEERIASYSRQIAELQSRGRKRPAPKKKFKTERKS